MRWLQIESSAIDAVSYAVEEKRLYVRFMRGAVWAYENVPPTVFCELLQAPSHGRYFIRHIRDSFLACEVQPEEVAHVFSDVGD